MEQLNDEELIRCLMLSDDARGEDTNDSIRNAVYKKGVDYVENIARDNKIIAYAAHVLKEVDPGDPRWEKIHTEYLDRNTKLIEILKELYADVATKGITSLCVTENFGSILHGKACLGCFQSSDIDMTADRSEQKLIEAIFEKYGFYLKSDTQQVTKYKNKELFGDGFSLQITWVAVARSYLNQDAPTARLDMCRRNGADLPETKIRVLEPTAQLYFCSYHISAGHYYTLTPGIRLYADIDRLLRGKPDINWESILEWSKEDNIGLRVMLPIYLSYRILCTPVPDSIIEYVEKSSNVFSFANRLLDKNDLGFGCNDGKIHRLYIDLASNGTSMGKALIYKIMGR